MNNDTLELLAAELGADVSRIEREMRLEVAAMRAELRQEIEALKAARAEAELRLVNAERALAETVATRLATVSDGRDGDAGVRGTRIYSGNGVPDIGDALIDDLYLDVTTGDVHKFIS